MESDRWQRIKSIFNNALELPEAEQWDFVERSCDDDHDLREQIEQLLRDHRRAGDFIETPVLGRPGVEPTAAELDNLPGQTVGHYKILHKIGQGGMSTVYLAARADQQYQQHVAVKIIRRGMDSDFIVARFRQERQILASLDHPLIAKLLDGGTLGDGRPYLVMEHIEGEPVDTYCDRAGLGLRQRLELFRKICGAVQYAHQNLVVHRDLKPSNILVTADGVPRVLDFGTAKLLEPLPVMMGVTPTAADLRLMTPEYASPEQMRGAPITTASDVYSLGVVLYELITGQRPYLLPERTSLEAARIVTEEPIDRPSQALSHSTGHAAPSATPAPEVPEGASDPTFTRLRRKLEGDLDNIVLMALRKEPLRRYASVEQLSSDIDRHLRGLPVSARRDTLGYRASKFVLRHRLAVAAAALAVVALLAGIVAIYWQARIAERERQRAEDNLAKSEHMFQFLTEVFENADPNKSLGEDLTVRDAFDSAVEVLDYDLADQPEVRAALLERFGVWQYGLGLYERSAKQLEEAVHLHRELLPADSPTLASSLDYLGVTQTDAGHYDLARSALTEALEIRRRTLPEDDPRIADSLIHLGLLDLLEGHADLAEANFQTALALHRSNSASQPIDGAAALQGLGRAALADKRYAEAEQIFEQTLELQRHEHGELHTEVIEEHSLLAVAVLRQGRTEEARALLLRELELNRKLHGEAHPWIAVTLNNLAVSSYGDKHYDEALDYFQQVLEMQRHYLRPNHHDLLATRSNIGSVLLAQGKPDESIAYLRQVLEDQLQETGEGHPYVAVARHNLAALLASIGQLEEAEQLYSQALDFRSAKLGNSHPDTLITRLGLSQLLIDQGKVALAEQQLLIAWNAASTATGDAWAFGLRAASMLADLYQQSGRKEQAAEFRTLATAPLD